MTMHRTTGAELQTLRECAGLSREALADLMGVEARSVKHWETRPTACPPDEAAQIAAEAAQWVASTARKCLDAIKHQPGASRALVRYKETAHLFPADRKSGIRADVHGAMIARVFSEASDQGLPCRVVWFDPAHYVQWLQAMHPNSADSEALRSDWARAAVESQSQTNRTAPAD